MADAHMEGSRSKVNELSTKEKENVTCAPNPFTSAN